MLIAWEREWMEVIQGNYTEALERILTPEYVYTVSGQGRWSRQQLRPITLVE